MKMPTTHIRNENSEATSFIDISNENSEATSFIQVRVPIEAIVQDGEGNILSGQESSVIPKVRIHPYATTITKQVRINERHQAIPSASIVNDYMIPTPIPASTPIRLKPISTPTSTPIRLKPISTPTRLLKDDAAVYESIKEHEPIKERSYGSNECSHDSNRKDAKCIAKCIIKERSYDSNIKDLKDLKSINYRLSIIIASLSVALCFSIILNLAQAFG